MFGSSDWLSLARCACSAVGVVKVNADDGGRCSAFCVSGGVGCCCGIWRADSMAACSGSSREVSIPDNVGVEPGFEGAGGGGIVVDAAARASHAAFSSSSLYFN
jgi:hypothetical protein